MRNHFSSALRSLWLSRWSTLFAVLSIGVSLFIVTVIFLGYYNIELFTRNLSGRVALVVYLKDGTPSKEISKFIEEQKNSGFFSKVKYITREEALNDLKNWIEPSLIELIGFNPLWDSVELFLNDEKLNEVEAIAEKLKSNTIVEDVYYPSKVISFLRTLKMTLYNLGVAVLALLLGSVLFIVYSTVKNHYWRKFEEIEILKLLGATPSYIRLPFMVEGGLIGLLGGFIATVAIISISIFIKSKNFIDFLPFLAQVVFPIEFVLPLPVFGLFLGVVASIFSLGKIRYQ